ncbi:MAG: methyltransferase [Thermoplasmata archaeon]|nr:methyltransferase [Thermoplasmata archaeon]
MKFDNELEIEVVRDVYSPSDDTFLMLSAILPRTGQSILEMGTGSGIIAMHCAKAGCKVTAADISEKALNCARNNARLNGINIQFVQSNLFSSIEEKFDMIIFNPPYLSGQDAEILAVDDKRQLIGGKGGHEISIEFMEQAVQYLSENGRIYILTSTETSEKIIERARQLFLVNKIAEKHMFFETLAVWGLRIDLLIEH